MERIAAIPPIVEQHAENAAFLFLRRCREIEGQLFNDTDLGRLDQRLDASLLGLASAGRRGWEIALARFGDWPEAGEVFVLGVLALDSGEPALVEAALAAGASAGAQGRRGLSGAVARARPEALRPFAAGWLDAPEPLRRWLGLCALSHHRIDPRGRLDGLIADPDARVRARALRLAGELGLRALLPRLESGYDADTGEERFRAAWSACLLGAPDAQRALAAVAERDPERRAAAIALRLIAGQGADTRAWLGRLIGAAPTRAAAIAQIGVMGDRGVMPWLIEAMRDPDRADPAGRAFRDLFAIDFNDTALFSSDPSLLGPAFSAAGPVALPVADRVAAWWNEGRGVPGAEPSPSLRQLGLAALRAAVATPGAPLARWRRTCAFPAWM